MCHRGFTQQELRDIFNLDPDRSEDRSTIAALQASSARLRVRSPAPAREARLARCPGHRRQADGGGSCPPNSLLRSVCDRGDIAEAPRGRCSP